MFKNLEKHPLHSGSVDPPDILIPLPSGSFPADVEVQD